MLFIACSLLVTLAFGESRDSLELTPVRVPRLILPTSQHLSQLAQGRRTRQRRSVRAPVGNPHAMHDFHEYAGQPNDPGTVVSRVEYSFMPSSHFVSFHLFSPH